jgi:hypothetical protein
MDEDVDMEFPQISTLPEEDSPPSPQQPPPQATSSKFKVKLVMNEPKGPPPSEKPPAVEEDEDDVDELVDELDDEAGQSISSSTHNGPVPPFTTAPLKGRKDRAPKPKAEKTRKRKAEKDPLQSVPAAAMATFESTFSVSPADPPGTIIEVDPTAPVQPRKKHASTPRKAAGNGTPRMRKTLSKYDFAV